MSRNKWILLGCGVALLIAACLVAALFTGGLGALVAVFGPEPEGLTATVDLPAAVVAGQPFELLVRATNNGASTLTIDEISLPAALLGRAGVEAVVPRETSRSDFGGDVAFQFHTPLEPGQAAEFRFRLEALEPGDASGKVDVVVGLRRAQAPFRLVVTSAVPPTPVSDSPAFEAVVQVIAMYEDGGELHYGWHGSGTIISPDGLILTNAHVVLPDKYYSVDALIVALTHEQDRPPEATFYAEVLQADPALDIAVIRVTTDQEGNPVSPSDLHLPYIRLGDSDSLALGDSIVILGYPGIGGDTITLTRGEVSGFTSQIDVGRRAFIKTSATIAGGNSGGLAANSQGELIGIPTQLGYGGNEQYVDCRVLADTNRDGVVDDEDQCVPTGGFINALRPANLALPLIEAAERGEVSIASAVVAAEALPAAGEILGQDDFSDVSSGWPTGNDDGISEGYRSGAYEVAVNRADRAVHSFAPFPAAPDVLVDVEATVTAATGVGEYGLICRAQDSENLYALLISEDGYFSIFELYAGEWTALHDWEISPHVPKPGDVAHLRAGCVGDTLTLEVNGTLLAQVTDSTFPDGRTGLFVGAFDPPGLAVSFDNFAVVRPAALQTDATSGDIVLEDDFSDPSSGWPRRTDERLIQDYTDGTYRIFVNDTDFDVWSTAGVDVDSVIVEADATFVNSPDDGVVGLICRYADPDNFYLAYVSATGASALYRIEEGERQSLLPDVWTQSSASYLGGGLNRLSFSCRDDQLELRINDQLVANARDTTFARGDVGLLAGSYTLPGVDVRFDNVVVRSP